MTNDEIRMPKLTTDCTDNTDKKVDFALIRAIRGQGFSKPPNGFLCLLCFFAAIRMNDSAGDRCYAVTSKKEHDEIRGFKCLSDNYLQL